MGSPQAHLALPVCSLIEVRPSKFKADGPHGGSLNDLPPSQVEVPDGSSGAAVFEHELLNPIGDALSLRQHEEVTAIDDLQISIGEATGQ